MIALWRERLGRWGSGRPSVVRGDGAAGGAESGLQGQAAVRGVAAEGQHEQIA